MLQRYREDFGPLRPITVIDHGGRDASELRSVEATAERTNLIPSGTKSEHRRVKVEIFRP